MAYKQRWINYFELLDSDNSGAISSDDIAEGVKVCNKSSYLFIFNLLLKLTAKSFGLKEGTPEYNLSASTYTN